MSHKIEFSTNCQDFNTTTPYDIASLKCGDTSISFLSRAKWFIVYKSIEDANKQSIQKFLADTTNTLNVMLHGAGTSCNIKIAENRFSISTSYDCGNFTGATRFSCQFDLDDNKTEIIKFINYLHQQYETKAQ
jgi:hypothetical protein